MSDPAPMTTASRLCTRDPLPPVISRSSLAGQVDASSRGQGICPARGWLSAGGCCGLAHLGVGGKHVLAMSIFCQLWWEVDPSALSGSEWNHWWRSHTTLCSGCAVVPSSENDVLYQRILKLVDLLLSCLLKTKGTFLRQNVDCANSLTVYYYCTVCCGRMLLMRPSKVWAVDVVNSSRCACQSVVGSQMHHLWLLVKDAWNWSIINFN